MAEGESAGLNLVQKLAKVRRKFGTVPERGRNDFHKYNYARVADMIGPIGDLLAELNVTVQRRALQVKRDFVKDGKTVYVSVSCQFVFIDGDAPIERTGRPNEYFTQSGYEEFVVESYGEGMDSGDKGVYKALTGAEKYCYRQTFQLATGDGDDAERESLTFDDEEPKRANLRVHVDRSTSQERKEKTARDSDAGSAGAGDADGPPPSSTYEGKPKGGGCTTEQIVQLSLLIKETNTKTDILFKSFKIKTLDELKPSQYENMLNILQARKNLNQGGVQT